MKTKKKYNYNIYIHKTLVRPWLNRVSFNRCRIFYYNNIIPFELDMPFYSFPVRNKTRRAITPIQFLPSAQWFSDIVARSNKSITIPHRAFKTMRCFHSLFAIDRTYVDRLLCDRWSLMNENWFCFLTVQTRTPPGLFSSGGDHPRCACVCLLPTLLRC